MATPKTLTSAQILIIARVMHEAMRAFQIALGETPTPSWSRAPKWMKIASVDSITFRLNNPNATPAQQHKRWMETKLEDGWKYGVEKHGVKKTHPSLVPYNKLPQSERQKDALVANIIDALTKDL